MENTTELIPLFGEWHDVVMNSLLCTAAASLIAFIYFEFSTEREDKVGDEDSENDGPGV